jgi:hypothetical protein
MKTTIKKVWTDNSAIYILTNGNQIYRELFSDYPRLRSATNKQLANYEYDNIGIHWDDVDEDLSFYGFITEKKKIFQTDIN